MKYTTLEVTIENHIANIAFNRPEKANSLIKKAWQEMKEAFEAADNNPDVRVIILSGVGKHFCAGIDLTMLMGIQASLKIECEGRKRETLRGMIAYLQDCISSIEKCRKPVLAAVQKACLGAGFAIATACDMRYCTEDAYFSVKEIDRGMVADVGTSQRLPKIIPYALACELAYTGRNVGGEEAKEIGLVNRVYANKEIMMEEVMKLAAMIATKSPLSIRGTKHIYKYSRDHSVQEGLDYMQTWNAAMFLSDDLTAAFQGVVEKKEPVYKN